jgi:hypothetical protein
VSVDGRLNTRPQSCRSVGTLLKENTMSSPALSRTRSPNLSVQADSPTAQPAALPRDGRRLPAAHSPAGRFRYDLRTSAWWWSPEVFAVSGLPADTAEATTQLLLQYLHPGDRAHTLAALTSACTEGRPFTVRARFVRGNGEERAVVIVGESDIGPDGTVCAVEGLVIDVTGCPGPPEPPDRTAALEAEVGQMRAAMASRATIEQAKGILMLLTNCGEHVAFELLAHISSHTHRKVRDVAESITESAAGHAQLPPDVRAIVRDACPPLQNRR